MHPPGFTCLANLAALNIQIQRSTDGLWNMQLFDRRGGFRVVMPPSEFGLEAAKEKALISAKFYMRKYGNDPEWNPPTTVAWHEFTPRSVVWET